jgi:hypothetical protein
MTEPAKPRPATKHGHNFQESYLRMKYASTDGSIVEWIWNSRDGITPFIVGAKGSDFVESERVDLQHVDWHLDEYRPNYVPEVGERIFVTLTEELARPEAVKYVDRFWDDEKYPMSKSEHFGKMGKAGAVEFFVTDWLKSWGGYPPTVVTVTAPMRAQFEARAEELAKGWRKL